MMRWRVQLDRLVQLCGLVRRKGVVLARLLLSRWKATRRARKQLALTKLSARLTAEFTEEELQRYRVMLADAHELRLPEDPELRERLMARSELLRTKFATPAPDDVEDSLETDTVRESATVVTLRKVG